MILNLLLKIAVMINDIEKTRIMQDAIKPIVDFIEQRKASRQNILNTLAAQPVDSTPESIRKMREEESAKLRAVIQEQSDILATIKVLFPNG